MEYGIAYVEGRKLHLYGSPGQRRFDFMAALLLKGAAGMMVTIDNGNSNPLGELDYYLKFHGEFLKKQPALIAVTHYDDTRTRTGLIDYHEYCRSQGFAIPVMRLDARCKEEVEKSLGRLVAVIDKRMQATVAENLLGAMSIA
jgi:signal recognition particle receptor subunit beta